MIGAASQMPRWLHHGTINCIPLHIPALAGGGKDRLAAFGRVSFRKAIALIKEPRGVRGIEHTY
ncbi:hypothetical protein D3C83_246630 [compost metagenome]